MGALPPLRRYQAEPARAIVKSVLNGEGLSFSVMMARQAGKNETSAQIELMLLAECVRRGWERSGIKCAPTLVPQARISQLRLLQKLREAGLGSLARTADGWRVCLGPSWMGFLSADMEANVVGQTASLILEADEAQDVDREKWGKEFLPMASSTNATRVFWGTAWSDDDLLQEAKQEHLRLERADGVRRHFEVPWEMVAEVSPAYGKHVRGQIAALGEDHPIIQTQYCLKVLPGEGRMFTATDRAVMQGGHWREDGPGVGAASYVASLDVGGTGELSPASLVHDATVLMVGRVAMVAGVGDEERLAVEVVRVYTWTGTPLAQLWPAIATVLRLWGVTRCCVDATGLGEAVAAYLLRLFGPRIEPFKFTGASKSELGYGLLAAVRSGRCRMFAGDGSAKWREFWHQVEAARSEYLPNKQMRFFVPEEDEGHDDYLVSLALLVRAAEAGRPRVARGWTRE